MEFEVAECRRNNGVEVERRVVFKVMEMDEMRLDHEVR